MSDSSGTSHNGKNYSDTVGGGPMRRSRHEGRSSRHGGESSGAGSSSTGSGSSGRYGSHHESRDDSNPCRSLFVRNLQFDTTEEEIYEIFAPYGDLKDVYSKISERGIVFIHYYDLRAAERAKTECDNTKIGGRVVDIHYSFPKDNIKSVKCDETKNQGTLLLSLNNTEENLVDDELYEQFQKFGDVKVIRTPTFKTYTENTERWQRLLEYYDSRAAVNAAKATHGTEYKTGVWDVNYFWDQGLRNNTGRDTSPSRRGDRYKRQLDQKPQRHEPYSQRRDHEQRMVHFSPPASRAQPSYGPSPQINTMVPPPGQQLDNAQKAQRLLSLLHTLQNSTSNQPPPPPTSSGQSFTNTQPPQQPTTAQGQGQVQQLLGILTQMVGNTVPPPSSLPAQPQQQQQQQTYTPWSGYQQPPQPPQPPQPTYNAYQQSYQYQLQPQPQYQYQYQPQPQPQTQPQTQTQPQAQPQTQPQTQPQHQHQHQHQHQQYSSRNDAPESHPPYSPNLPYHH